MNKLLIATMLAIGLLCNVVIATDDDPYIEEYTSYARDASGGLTSETDDFYQDDKYAKFKIWVSPRDDPHEITVEFTPVGYMSNTGRKVSSVTKRAIIEPNEDFVRFDLKISGATRQRYVGGWTVLIKIDGELPTPPGPVDFDVGYQTFHLNYGDRP